MKRNIKTVGLGVGVSVAAVVAGALVAAQQMPGLASATGETTQLGGSATPSSKPAVPVTPKSQTPYDALSEENVIRERLYFDVTGQFLDAARLHGETDAVKHEPCTLLCDAQSAVYLVRTDPVLCIRYQPDRGQPLV